LVDFLKIVFSEALVQMVSDEKLLEIGQSETRIACGGHVC
jgi:hypothetical protein